ncbi:MAG: hypothetical protein ACI9KS_000355 [Sulfitobacter sp.]|jgi:hypothetical protein
MNSLPAGRLTQPFASYKNHLAQTGADWRKPHRCAGVPTLWGTACGGSENTIGQMTTGAAFLEALRPPPCRTMKYLFDWRKSNQIQPT